MADDLFAGTAAVYERRQTIVPPPNNLPYIVAVVVMVVVGVAAFAAIAIARPAQDLGALAGQVFSVITPTTVALLAFLKAQETHLSVNSRLDAFMANAKLAAHAQGVTEGRLAGRLAADARTDQLAGNDPLPPKKRES